MIRGRRYRAYCAIVFVILRIPVHKHWQQWPALRLPESSGTSWSVGDLVEATA